VTLLVFGLGLGLALGALAQGEGVTVTLTRVESEAFPWVTAYVTVMDRNGLPVIGLTETDFQVFENGAPIPTASVAVESDTSEALRLVLALDLSTPETSLKQVREAAQSFLDMLLGPQDKAAILAFDRQVEMIQGFTNDKTALKAALDALTDQHNYTALNEAVFEAADMVSQFPSGRKVVVVLTDIENNIGTLSADEAIGKAQEVGVPVHVIGFGSKIKQPEALHEIARLTGGQSYVLSSSDEVPDRLQTLGVLLRQGYKLAFQSTLGADGTEYDLSIRLIYQGEKAEAASHFVATPGEVTVIPSIDAAPVLAHATAERTVGGIVNLTAQATAPASIVSVEYLLDGQSLVKVADPPYSFDWNSADIAPGAHVLTVKAVDSAGNQGQAELPLTVVLPVAVKVSPLPDIVALGETLTIEAQVESPGDLTSIEFLLDGQPMAQTAQSRYTFDWRSVAVEPGAHTLTVRATDAAGHTAQAETNFNVAPPVVVTAAAAQDSMPLGDEVVVEAQVEAMAEVTRVELLVDGRSLGSAPGPPYRFSFDSGEYLTGEHVVTVHAEDILGRVGEAKLNLRFLDPPPPAAEPKPMPAWRRAAALAALLVAAFVAVATLIIIAQMQRKKLIARRRLAISNTGNVRNRYELHARDTAGVLKFEFSLNGTKLARHQVAHVAESVEVATVTEVSDDAEMAGETVPAAPAVDLGKAKQTVGQAKTMSGLASTVLGGLGALLPGSLGQPFKNMSQKMRRKQSDTGRAIRVPKDKLDRAKALRGQVTQGSSKGSQTREAVPSSKAEASHIVASVEREAVPATTVTRIGQPTVEAWSQTPFVEPGETLTVALLIDPLKPHRTQDCSFQVVSRGIEQKDAPPVVKEGSIHIEGISWFRLYLPALAFGIVSAAAILSIVFLLANAGFWSI
jgi:VWFA-related protein